MACGTIRIKFLERFDMSKQNVFIMFNFLEDTTPSGVVVQNSMIKIVIQYLKFDSNVLPSQITPIH